VSVKKPKKGDLVVVTFVDLAGDVTSSSREADIPIGQAAGWFVGWRKINGVKALICEETKWNKPGWGTGWKSWPEGVIKSVEVVNATPNP
jgi:hypothetical protein